jgi:hypothetical protein
MFWRQAGINFKESNTFGLVVVDFGKLRMVALHGQQIIKTQ